MITSNVSQNFNNENMADTDEPAMHEAAASEVTQHKAANDEQLAYSFTTLILGLKLRLQNSDLAQMNQSFAAEGILLAQDEVVTEGETASNDDGRGYEADGESTPHFSL